MDTTLLSDFVDAEWLGLAFNDLGVEMAGLVIAEPNLVVDDDDGVVVDDGGGGGRGLVFTDMNITVDGAGAGGLGDLNRAEKLKLPAIGCDDLGVVVFLGKAGMGRFLGTGPGTDFLTRMVLSGVGLGAINLG